jgi:hypothetical protein
LCFVHFVADVDDDLVWKAFEQAVRRAGPALRMEMLHELARSEKPAARRRILTFLAAFLGDRAAREKGLVSIGAGFPFDAISVRNAAAMEMARLLGIELPFVRERKAEEWAKLRSTVREAWERERDTLPSEVK